MISLEWVMDYINLDGEDLKLLAEKITKAGINVEKVITSHIDHLVIGEVLSSFAFYISMITNCVSMHFILNFI